MDMVEQANMTAMGGHMADMTTAMAGHDHSGHNHGTMDDMANTMTDHDKHGTIGGASVHGGHPLYFSFNFPVTLLFFEWFITDSGQLAAACVGVFLFAILYEGLKVFRKFLLVKSKNSMEKKTKMQRIFNGCHIFQSFLQIIQTTAGMLLMLVYMTFNVWLALSVSVGSGIGYFFFSWTRFAPLDDSCHGM